MLFSSTYSFCFSSIWYLGSYFFDLNVCIPREIKTNIICHTHVSLQRRGELHTCGKTQTHRIIKTRVVGSQQHILFVGIARRASVTLSGLL